jgi:serine/threonine protein kinase
MAIGAGARFNHYEIIAQLGAGGMGEVWRARDTRLDREVAIKVLPANYANDEDRNFSMSPPMRPLFATVRFSKQQPEKGARH